MKRRYCIVIILLLTGCITGPSQNETTQEIIEVRSGVYLTNNTSALPLPIGGYDLYVIGEEHGIHEIKTLFEMSFKFDIAISFAGEDREISERLAEKLQSKGIKVFYDRFFRSELWGKELTKYFQEVYGPKTKFVVLLLSKHYPVKKWTGFEFSIMDKEAEKRKNEFILPVRLDDTKMEGIKEDVAYLDYRKEGIDGIVECLLEKLSESSDQK
jgi:hypothetical protein